jgi:hypothetical protein
MPKVVPVLIAISIIGILGIPLGDPKFIAVALALEGSFIVLTVLSIKKLKYALIPNIAIACIVISGNTLSPVHINIMLSLTPIYNAIILLIGGYILQGLLVITTVADYEKIKQTRIKDTRYR